MSAKHINIKNHALKLRDFFLDILFPIECLGCGHARLWLCDECFKKLKINQAQYCLKCKKENALGCFCQDCLEVGGLDGCLIAGDYQDKLLALTIKRYKYHFIKDLSQDLGNFLTLFLYNFQKNTLEKYPIYPRMLIDLETTLIITVPLHKKRLNWRGFNQAEELAKIVSDNFKLKLEHGLVRQRYKKPQVKFKAEKRRENIKNCFAWKGGNLDNQDVLLIDDVTTTGSTLNECAKILKQNGARKVWGLVVANG